MVDGAINMDEGSESEVVSVGNATPPSPTQEEDCVVDCEARVGGLISAEFWGVASLYRWAVFFRTLHIGSFQPSHLQ